MSVTLVLPDSLVSDLEAKATLPVETAGVLLVAQHHTSEGAIRLLARSLHWVPDRAYELRTADEMLITSEGYVEALALAEQDGSVPLWLHTHPRGRPVRSAKDEGVDKLIADVFRLRSGANCYGTVIVSPAPDGLSLTGTVQQSGCAAKEIDHFWMVGERWRMQPAFGSAQDSLRDAVFDRNVRAFGKPVQRMIGMLRIGVVGCGGTGSAVAEQLVRLGARHLLLVDADTLSASNVTRVYGFDARACWQTKNRSAGRAPPPDRSRSRLQDGGGAMHVAARGGVTSQRRSHLRLHRRQRRSFGSLAALLLVPHARDRHGSSTDQ